MRRLIFQSVALNCLSSFILFNASLAYYVLSIFWGKRKTDGNANLKAKSCGEGGKVRNFFLIEGSKCFVGENRLFFFKMCIFKECSFDLSDIITTYFELYNPSQNLSEKQFWIQILSFLATESTELFLLVN
jgi:hypothetical protein